MLIDLSGPLYFVTRGNHTGGTYTFTYVIPTDPSFCGFRVTTQAIVFGTPGPELTNALDFMTGR